MWRASASVVWRLDSILGTDDSARQVQTDLGRGFGHAGVENWGTLGSVVLRLESWVLLNEPGLTQQQLLSLPIGPAATSGVQILGIPCRQLSVSHHLPLLWIGFELGCVAGWTEWVRLGTSCTSTIGMSDLTKMIFDGFYNFGAEASLELQRVSVQHTPGVSEFSSSMSSVCVCVFV